jgi:hypothetical protein
MVILSFLGLGVVGVVCVVGLGIALWSFPADTPQLVVAPPPKRRRAGALNSSRQQPTRRQVRGTFH